MNELSGVADFILKYGWLGVTLITWFLFLFEVIHSDKSFQRELDDKNTAIAQRDEAIKLAQSLTEVLESGRRGTYRGDR